MEHFENGAFTASGFDTLPARVLLDFCEKYGMCCEVIFEKAAHSKHKSFQIHFYYDTADEEAPPRTNSAPVSLESVCVDEKEMSKLQALSALLPVHTASVEIVTFPRVLHIRIHCKKRITSSELDELLHAPFVRDVRLGGISQAVEIVVRRASRFKKNAPRFSKRAQRPVRLPRARETCQTRRVRTVLGFDQ